MSGSTKQIGRKSKRKCGVNNSQDSHTSGISFTTPDKFKGYIYSFPYVNFCTMFQLSSFITWQVQITQGRRATQRCKKLHGTHVRINNHQHMASGLLPLPPYKLYNGQDTNQEHPISTVTCHETQSKNAYHHV